MSRRLVIALMLGLALPAAAVGQDSTRVPTVAVIDFTVLSLSPGEDTAAVARGLAAMITTELGDRPGVDVVDRQRVQELIETRQLAVSGRMDEARAQQLGRVLGADYLVIGNVTLEPERIRIDLRLMDAGSSAVARSSKQQGRRDDLLEMVVAVADDFTEGLKLPAWVATDDVEPPAAAILAYSRGLDYERRGMERRAAEMYRRALELFPRHEAAAAALERVGGGTR